jgi:flagellar motility protein MotE (MotC chaperone)
MKRRVGGGSLILVALFFASSGALRIGDSIGTALAEAKGKEEADASKDLSQGEPNAEEHASAEDSDMEGDASCPPPPAELAASLLEREGRLASQEAAIADREAAIALANEAVTLRLEELKKAEEELRATLALADGAAEEDIARLVAVYETMKPKDAARLFDAMDAEFAAGFLGSMRPDAAGAIMAGMTPEKAYAVTAILAGRNSSVPKE